VLPDSNVYGPLMGLWPRSNSFHSPTREPLYSLPYPLRIERHPDDRAVPHETKTSGAVIDALRLGMSNSPTLLTGAASPMPSPS
jgi:hypothetical protein